MPRWIRQKPSIFFLENYNSAGQASDSFCGIRIGYLCQNRWVGQCGELPSPRPDEAGLRKRAVVLPKYKSISPKSTKLKLEFKDMPVPMGMGEMNADILSTRLGDTHGKVYILQNDHYFDRDGIYGTSEGDSTTMRNDLPFFRGPFWKC